MQRALRLSLISPLYYFPASMTLEEAVRISADKNIGYDAVLRYSYAFCDEHLEITAEAAGEREGYTEEEKRILEEGGIIERKEGEEMEIPAGTYLFEQLPFIPEEKDLTRIILPYLTAASGSFYARIYKENILECVFQLLFPST